MSDAEPQDQGPFDRLTTIMARLRDPDSGCPWDVEQDFVSIAPYTIEEAHEVADAIARNDMADLKDELGDLLLQVVFHARMAEEAGYFDVADVANAISDKMVRRHPHVFGDAPRTDGHAQWEAIKAAERDEKDDKSALAGVANGLPALMRAHKLQKRAARVGFDWPDASGPRAKILEELGEIDGARSDAERVHEVGDLLFSAVNLARHLDVDPEEALRGANRRFEDRFRQLETAANAPLTSMSIDELEELWQQAKRRLQDADDAAP